MDAAALSVGVDDSHQRAAKNEGGVRRRSENMGASVCVSDAGGSLLGCRILA